MSIKFPEPTVLAAADALELLDKVAQKRLACSAQEFLRRWDAGEYHDTDTAAVAEVSALIPFIR